MNINIKPVVAIALVGMCFHAFLIQSRRGVSEDRVKGQMDSDAAVTFPGAGAYKRRFNATRDVSVSFDGESLNQLHTTVARTAKSLEADEDFGFDSLRSETRDVVSQSSKASKLSSLIRGLFSTDYRCVKKNQTAEVEKVKEELLKLEQMVQDAENNFLNKPKQWSGGMWWNRKIFNQIQVFQYCQDALDSNCYWKGKKECTENDPPISPELKKTLNNGVNGTSMVEMLLKAAIVGSKCLSHSKSWARWGKKSGCQVDAQTPLYEAWAKNWSCVDDCADKVLNKGRLRRPPHEECMNIVVPGSGDKSKCADTAEKCYQNTWKSCCCREGLMYAPDSKPLNGCNAKCEKKKNNLNEYENEWHWYTQQRMKLVMDKMFNLPKRRCDYDTGVKIGYFSSMKLATRIRGMMERKVFRYAVQGMRPPSQEMDELIDEASDEELIQEIHDEVAADDDDDVAAPPKKKANAASKTNAKTKAKGKVKKKETSLLDLELGAEGNVTSLIDLENLLDVIDSDSADDEALLILTVVLIVVACGIVIVIGWVMQSMYRAHRANTQVTTST